MTPPLRDFVSTYRPPKQPEPFFGFFEVDEPRKRRTDGTYYNNKKKRNAGNLTTGKLQREGISINERFEKYYKNMTHIEKVQQRADALAAKEKAPKRPIKFLSSKDSQFRRELAEKKLNAAPKSMARETKGEKIWNLHEAGMTLKEISIEMNMTRNNVGAHLSTERKKRGLI